MTSTSTTHLPSATSNSSSQHHESATTTTPRRHRAGTGPRRRKRRRTTMIILCVLIVTTLYGITSVVVLEKAQRGTTTMTAAAVAANDDNNNSKNIIRDVIASLILPTTTTMQMNKNKNNTTTTTSKDHHRNINNTDGNATTMTTTTGTAAAQRSQFHHHHHDNNNINNNMTTTARSNKIKYDQYRFAYVFLIGGCDPVNRPTYRYFLLNVLVAAKLLRDDGSTADIIVMIQMAHSSTHYTKLPHEEEHGWLARYNVSVVYLPQPTAPQYDSYYSVQIQKFRVVGMTQYDRVLFLDADLMPFGNLDYIFHASVDGILMENLVLPEARAPANGGFFLMTPHANGLAAFDAITQRKETRYNSNGRRRHRPQSKSNNNNNITNNLYWDNSVGWGHVMNAPRGDYWECINKTARSAAGAGAAGTGAGGLYTARTTRQTLWDWSAASADQGLLYYYTKYHRKSVSIVWAHTVENWGVVGDGRTKQQHNKNGDDAGADDDDDDDEEVVQLLETITDPFLNYTSCRYRNHWGPDATGKCALLSPVGCHPPMSDFDHFFTVSKPWLRRKPNRLSEKTKLLSTRHLWYYTLQQLNEELDLKLVPRTLQFGNKATALVPPSPLSNNTTTSTTTTPQPPLQRKIRLDRRGQERRIPPLGFGSQVKDPGPDRVSLRFLPSSSSSSSSNQSEDRGSRYDEARRWQ